MPEDFLSNAEAIIADIAAGKMVVLVDDEDRENEGDLVIAAEFATPEAVNFMAKHGRGLICLSMDKQRIAQLGLPPMAQHNATRHHTAFTVSIEAREGVTTGISAADRACTIAVAIDPAKGKTDLVSPGHIFPLEAREGGVLVRAGHTEAAVDLARLAGLNPSGVICEIMNDDGTMARLPDLIPFAQKHGLKIGTIADLIAYRRRKEKLVERVVETALTSKWGGEWRMIIYATTTEYAEHIALVKGDITPDAPTLVRVHALDVLRDVLGDVEHGSSKQKSMQMIADAGKGVLVLIREPSRTHLSDVVKQRLGHTTPDGEEHQLRHYGIGAQILLDLGVRDMVLLSNTDKHIIGLEGYGLKVVERRGT